LQPRFGFTIIELLVVMAVLAVLASLVMPRYVDKVETARETVLRQDLQGLRLAIDQFYRDQSRYPENLQELVTKRYIRAIPVDPVTDKAETWVTTPSKEGIPGVFDVHSGSPLKARDGSSYASW
jgi:general secretion pathway protein G